MIRIVHLSDLHFGRADPVVVDGLVTCLNRLKPAIVVISGDLTQSAKRKEFEEAREFLNRLPGEHVIVPGNHDLPGWRFWHRFINPYRHYLNHIEDELDLCRHIGDVKIVGLNSSRRVLAHWNWSHGAVSDRQIAFMKNCLEKGSDSNFSIVTVHHPLVPPIGRINQKLIGNGSAFANALGQGQADLVMTGHLHTYQIRFLHEHYNGIDRNVPVLQTATSTSTRLRDHANGFSCVDYSGQYMVIGSWLWADNGFYEHRPVGLRYEPGAGWHNEKDESADAGNT